MFRGENFRPSSGTLYHNVVLLRMGEIFAPKHVELIEITNKLLLLHPVGCLYYYYICLNLLAKYKTHKNYFA